MPRKRTSLVLLEEDQANLATVREALKTPSNIKTIRVVFELMAQLLIAEPFFAEELRKSLDQ